MKKGDLASAWARSGFPWYARYERRGNREIFKVVFTEGGALREKGPLIEGVVWESGRDIQAFYEAFFVQWNVKAPDRVAVAGDHQAARGFVRWAHAGGDEGFNTWEEAVQWLEQHEGP